MKPIRILLTDEQAEQLRHLHPDGPVFFAAGRSFKVSAGLVQFGYLVVHSPTGAEVGGIGDWCVAHGLIPSIFTLARSDLGLSNG